MDAVRVDSARFHPGCCLVTGEHADLIDLLRDDVFDRRMYLSVQLILDLARQQLGMWGPQEIAAARETIEALEQEQVAYQELQEQHAELVNALRVTLAHGGVVDQKTGRVKLRTPPGVSRKAIEEAMAA